MHADASRHSALDSFLVRSLASLLKERGVPHEVVNQRAAQAITALGSGQVQKAMLGSNPWKELKALGNLHSPPFHFLLPSELQAVVAAKARAGGHALGNRQKAKSKVPAVPAHASPVMPDLDQVTIPSGVFVDGDSPLAQIPIGDVGPTSAGVVLVRPEQAAPYFKLSRPVSRAALALVVVGEFDLGEVTVKFEVLRFRATSTKSALPLLLSGTLLQIGDRWVSKHAPKVTNVEVVPSEVLRIAVFRDQFEGDWDTFTIRPLREIIQVVPCLRTCSVAGCTCAAWHGSSAPGEPEAILECWARSWHSLRTSKPRRSQQQSLTSL